MIILDKKYNENQEELREYVEGRIEDAVCEICSDRWVCIEAGKESCFDLKKILNIFREVCHD